MNSIEESVVAKFRRRAIFGFIKYNATLERADFTELDWMVYAQEEAIDFIKYLERMIQDKRESLGLPRLDAPLPDTARDQFLEQMACLYDAEKGDKKQACTTWLKRFTQVGT